MEYHGRHTSTSQSTGSLESEFVRHIECPNCGSSDGNSLYSDGHTFCFVCHKHSQSSLETHPRQLTNAILLQGSAERLQKRGISEKTCQQYKIYRDGGVLRFYYHSRDGLLQGCKVKTKSKDFSYEGDTPGTFFGQHLFPSSGRRVVITEGELDAASCSEAMPSWPMVSLPSGAAAARKSVQRNLDWLQGYEEIVLFFDNDEAGRKATAEACEVLPPGKVKIALLKDEYKDASDALIANDSDAIRRAIWDAKPYRPDGIVDAKTLLEIVTTPSPDSDYDYPYSGLQEKLHGIRLGELTTITAGSGIGKSSFCRELATYLLNENVRVGYLALEESVRRTSLGLMSAGVGKSLHLGEPTHEELTKAFDETIAKWNLFLFDGFGSYDPDVIYNRIEYLACGLDCKIIFLDHLSILLSGLEGDERRMLDQTMTKLRSLVERTGVSLFLVCHTTTPQNGQSHEEGGRVQLRNLRGSRSIGQLSDNVIALERDQQSGSDGDATTVRILKNRYSGEVGEACLLRYDLDNCKFIETEHDEPFNPSTDF